MNLNGFFQFIQDFSYKTFEIIPVLGNKLNLVFLLAASALFLYWLKVLANTPKEK